MKRLLAVTLSALLVLTMATGCAKKETARELLLKAVEQSATLTSSSVDMNMTGKVVPNEAMMAQDPSVQTLVDTINAGKVAMTMAADNKVGNANGKITVESNGMSFAFDLNMIDFKKFVVKTPFMEQFITMDLVPEGTEKNPIDPERMKAINKEMAPIFLGALKDEMLTAEYKVGFEGKEGKVDLNYVTIKMDNTQLFTFLKEVVPAVYNAPETKKLMSESIKSSLEAAGETAEQADIDKQIEDSIAAFPESVDMIQKNFTFDTVVIKLGMDKDHNMRSMDVTAGGTFKQEEQEVKISVASNSQFYGFNKPVEAAKIELTEENSMPFEEFIMAMLMGGMGGQ